MAAIQQAVLFGLGGFKQSPIVVGASINAGSGSSSEATVPAGNVGDRLLYFVSVSAPASRSAAIPTGFSENYNVIPSGVTNHRRAACFSKVADGSEETITSSNGGTSDWSVVIVRIRGEGTVSFSAGVDSTGSSVADPPSHTAPWGIEGNLWLAAAHGFSTLGTAPTNYTMANSTNSGDTGMAVAWRAVSSATEDPGAFGTSTAGWYATTIVAEPD